MGMRILLSRILLRIAARCVGLSNRLELAVLKKKVPASKNTVDDADTELLNMVFRCDPMEELIQKVGILPVHEGGGTTKSIWNSILYPFRAYKNKRREAEIRKHLFYINKK
jgi:hypothetical protein